MTVKPNRVVIEIDRTWQFTVRAERPDEVVVILLDGVLFGSPGYEPRVFGDGALPIERLTIKRALAGVASGPTGVSFKVDDS